MMDIALMGQSLIIAAVTGGVGSFATVKALRVHIDYLREHNVAQDLRIKEAEDGARHAMQVANQAHTRLDVIRGTHE